MTFCPHGYLDPQDCPHGCACPVDTKGWVKWTPIPGAPPPFDPKPFGKKAPSLWEQLNAPDAEDWLTTRQLLPAETDSGEMSFAE